MIITIFDKKKFNLQLIILVLIWSLFLLFPVNIIKNIGFDPFYKLIFSTISASYILIKVFYFLLILSNSLIIKFFLIKYGLSKKHQYHVFFIIPILLFTSQSAFNVSPPLVATFFMLLGLYKLCDINQKDNKITKLSSSAILFSVSSLFFFPFVIYILLLIISLIIFRQLKTKTLLAVIISFTLPYIYLFTYFFINNEFIVQINRLTNSLFLKYTFLNLFETPNWSLSISLIIITISTVFVVWSIITKLNTKLIQTRFNTTLLFFTLVITILLPAITGHSRIYTLTTISFVLSIIFSIYFSENKVNWISEILILLILILNYITLFTQFYA